jgi:hypothetical protein
MLETEGSPYTMYSDFIACIVLHSVLLEYCSPLRGPSPGAFIPSYRDDGTNAPPSNAGRGALRLEPEGLCSPLPLLGEGSGVRVLERSESGTGSEQFACQTAFLMKSESMPYTDPSVIRQHRADATDSAQRCRVLQVGEAKNMS